MPLYEITAENLNELKETSFETVRLRERFDLQRLLRKQIDVIAPDTLVIAEEFGEWEESKRRIDLLALDKDANLVVIELKRTDDGGHMELQAIRYAAMVSTMTFDKVVEIYGKCLERQGRSEDARALVLEFLGWDEPDDDVFAQDVRILLVSANFSKELTTAVMWLNKRDLDIRCVRVVPHQDNGRVLVNVQQVIPLPEAGDYQIQIREKEYQERKARNEINLVRRKFWQGLLAIAAQKSKLHANISPTDYHWVGAGAGVGGVSYNYLIRKHAGTVELALARKDQAANKKMFDELVAHKGEIDQVFGESLKWERLDTQLGSKLAYDIELGGYLDESNWPAIHLTMVEAMVRLERAVNPFLTKLKAMVG
ncbi:MAG TPA: DUF4268 domain-containing protein [Pyrinomonadaceae bacterium]